VDLTAHIYDALTDEDAFQALPDRLAAAVGARSATLQVFDTRGGFQEMTFNHFTREMFEFYVAEAMFNHDIWRLPPRRNAMDRFVLITEQVPVQSLTRSTFYNEFLRPFGDDTAQCVGGVFRLPTGTVSIGMHRAAGDRPFEVGDLRILDPLAPHLKRLYEVRGALARADQRLKLTEGVLDAQTNAVFVVDEAARPLYLNRRAQEMLDEDNGLQLTPEGLRALDARTSKKLGEACAAACARVRAAGGVLATPRRTGPPLRVVVTPWVFGDRTRALVVVHDPARQDRLLGAKLVALYGLTASEAATAIGLARGLSPSAVADQRSVALPTIRSQIRQILAKLDARSIPELVALVAAMPAEG
jgi:DNA-binding CsgD family transcriptional regulator